MRKMRGFLGNRMLRFGFLGKLKQGSNLAESDGDGGSALQGWIASLFYGASPFYPKRNPSLVEEMKGKLYRCPECDMVVSHLVLDLTRRKYVCEVCQNGLSGLEVYTH